MSQFTLLFFTFVVLGCGSPRSHRFTIDNNDLQKNNTSSLSFKTSQLIIKTQWLSGPFGSVEKKSTLVVYIYNTNGDLASLTNNLDLSFYAAMPSMGHPLSHPGYFQKISEGVYLNKDILFNMSGDWLMELSIVNNDGQTQEEIKWPYFF